MGAGTRALIGVLLAHRNLPPGVAGDRRHRTRTGGRVGRPRGRDRRGATCPAMTGPGVVVAIGALARYPPAPAPPPSTLTTPFWRRAHDQDVRPGRAPPRSARRPVSSASRSCAPRPPASPNRPTRERVPSPRLPRRRALCAEVDERLNAHRRERRIAEAHFPRLKRLGDFDLAASKSVGVPETIALLSSLSFLDRGGAGGLLGRQWHRQVAPPDRDGPRRMRGGQAGPLCHLCRAGERLPEAQDDRGSPGSSPAMAGSTCYSSTSSAMSRSTAAAPSCCSRSSPSARSGPRSLSARTCRSPNGARS